MSMDKDALIKKLGDALNKLKEHFDYCGGGDAWERECWDASGGEEEVDSAITAFEEYEKETGA